MRNGLLALGLLLTACGDKDDKDDTGDPATVTVPEVLSDCSAYDDRPVTLSGAEITGDTLALTVGYGGGCETHSWSLCWPDQVFAESEPVQVFLTLWHSSNGDMCDAWFEEELPFDLTPLREAWQDGYQSESGEITVHIDGVTTSYVF